jgi:endonuclease III-like uncharacterized protein
MWILWLLAVLTNIYSIVYRVKNPQDWWGSTTFSYAMIIGNVLCLLYLASFLVRSLKKMKNGL